MRYTIETNGEGESGKSVLVARYHDIRRTRHAGHCWRSKDELISDVLLWTPAYGQSTAGRTARTYIQHLWEDTRCSHEDLPETRWIIRKSGERGSGISMLAAWHDDIYTYIHTHTHTYIYIYIYIYIIELNVLLNKLVFQKIWIII